jgi:hypothetical protein
MILRDHLWNDFGMKQVTTKEMALIISVRLIYIVLSIQFLAVDNYVFKHNSSTNLEYTFNYDKWKWNPNSVSQ